MIDPESARAIYVDFIAARTHARVAGRLPALSLPFSYPDGESIQVYFRSMPDGSTTITDYGRTLAFLEDYGALANHPKQVVDVIADLCIRYEAEFADAEVRVSVSPAQIGEGLCCITEAIQAVAGMIALADVLHPGGAGGGQQVLTRFKCRLREAGLMEMIFNKRPIEVNGKSKRHGIRFAYPDRSAFILTQSLRSDPDARARQVSFDCIDILAGLKAAELGQPNMMCVYQSPTTAKTMKEKPDALKMLSDWFAYVYDIDADADRLIGRIQKETRSQVTEELFDSS